MGVDWESEGEMGHDFKVFDRETRSKGIVRTSGKVEFGGKIRHLVLNMFEFEMPIVHSSGDSK